jgi:putative sigma-54 modulation protein
MDMQTMIRTHGLTLTEELRSRAERSIHFALGRFSTSIRSVSTLLADQNGPRGGIDKRCSVLVRGRGWQVVVHDDDADAMVAMDRAADRAARSVARKLDRRRETTRREGS